MDHVIPKERIGVFEGQASAFYNVSPIERDYFEMWYFTNLSAYKGAAHGDPGRVALEHQRLAASEASITDQARRLREVAAAERAGGRADPAPLWHSGEYTALNRERN
jgi:hydroxylamine dehydrogenase